ncbi:unnamed protein product [Durusdinium trenchii]|uniref:Uncharacterized protein n=2 Tax=Durusdinium trenchii TaxID=1381693 RepID=A0ABP0RKV7_9DINO
MGAGADETAESLNEQVQRLRTENVKLRELLDAMGVELPGLNDGGITGVADALVALMSEGGSLLREREELILEHARLTVAQQAADDQDPDLDRLLEALLEVDALNAEREQLRAEQGLHREEVDDFEDALTRLRPLLTETDSLRAERQRLTSERQSLVEAVEAVGRSAEEIICEDDRDLELQLLSAVKGVAVENESLKAEIQDLRAQISRLRNHSSDRCEDLPVLHQVDRVPRVNAPSPVPDLCSRGANTLVQDRPSKPEVVGAFLANAEPKESRSGELQKLQEIIDRLQSENAQLKSHIVGLSPQESDTIPSGNIGDTLPEAPLPLPEHAEEQATQEATDAEQAAGDMLPEAPPAPPQDAAEEGILTEESTNEAAGNMRPEAPPPPHAKEVTIQESQEVREIPGEGEVREFAPEAEALLSRMQERSQRQQEEKEPRKPRRKANAHHSNVRPKEEVQRPRAPPDELFKQAGIPITTEAMLQQLLSPSKGKKVLLPRTLSLTPEDKNATAQQRQEARCGGIGILCSSSFLTMRRVHGSFARALLPWVNCYGRRCNWGDHERRAQTLMVAAPYYRPRA